MALHFGSCVLRSGSLQKYANGRASRFKEPGDSLEECHKLVRIVSVLVSDLRQDSGRRKERGKCDPKADQKFANQKYPHSSWTVSIERPHLLDRRLRFGHNCQSSTENRTDACLTSYRLFLPAKPGVQRHLQRQFRLARIIQ